MTAPDTAPDLFRRACEVMGYHVWEDDADRPFVSNARYPITDMRNSLYLDDEWNILRLIVEWIEARGCSIYFDSQNEQRPELIAPVAFRVTRGQGDDGAWAYAATLPLAAATVIVEHGEKIAKEQGT